MSHGLRWRLVGALATLCWLIALTFDAGSGARAATPASGSAGSGPDWLGLIVNSVSSPGNTATPFHTATDKTDSALGLGFVPTGVAITPDGRTAWTTNSAPQGFDGSVIPVDLSQSPPVVEQAVTVPGAKTAHYCQSGPENVIVGLGDVAISPDGKWLWAIDASTDAVYPVDISKSPAVPGNPIGLPMGAVPSSVALSTDGAKVLVPEYGKDKVAVISSASGAISVEIPLAAGAKPSGVAVTPDGRFAYVSEGGLSQVVPIDLSTDQLGPPISVGAGAGAMAITPDGAKVYVTDGIRGITPDTQGNCVFGAPADNTVSVISTATNSVVATVSGVAGASGPAVTPDGATVYVAAGGSNGAPSSMITPIVTATDTVTAGSAFGGGPFPSQVAISPDQGPVANFTVQSQQAGQPTSFDGSSSFATSGSIASYGWSFGDGTTRTTSTPTVTHVYQSGGTFNATLTVTDSAGTSTQEVFTGHMAVRNGTPAAATTKSVVVSAGPAPAVSIDTATVDFGTLAPGRQGSPVMVVVKNTGTAVLSITSTGISGANPNDFVITQDGCSGATVAPTGSCATSVAFKPAGTGARTAQLRFVDNASGSPHTVFLRGVSDSRGTVTGVVLDATSAGQPPVRGAAVYVCMYSTRAICRQATTDAAGKFRIGGLPPARYGVEILPSGGDLFPGSAVVDVTAGGTAEQVFALHAALGIPSGVEFNGASGGSGAPPGRSFWTAPTELGLRLDVPSGVPAGDFGATIADFSAGPDSAGALNQAVGALTVIYRYDRDGVPRFVEADSADPFSVGGPGAGFAGALGAWNVALSSPPKVGDDVRGLRISATLTPPANGPYFHGGAAYEVQQTTVAFTIPGGGRADRGAVGHQAQGKSGFGSNMNMLNHHNNVLGSMQNGSGGKCGKVFSGNQRFYDPTKNSLSDPATSRPRHKYKIGAQPVGQLPNGDKLYQAVREDGKTYYADGKTGEVYSYDQRTNTYQQINPAPGPASRATDLGLAHAAQEGDFGSGGNDACQHDDPMSGYVDPSGVVVTTAGIPVDGARVTLLRAMSRSRPFAPLARGSTVMSPSNRRNPDHSDQLGHFGWDVLSGVYRVTATHAGCRARSGRLTAATPPLTVPPPAIGLKLIVRCPRLHRAAVSVGLRIARAPVHEAFLIARVRRLGRASPRVRPAGLVTFASGGRRLGVAPVNSRTGAAVLVVAASRLRGATIATYTGDGIFGPTRSR